MPAPRDESREKYQKIKKVAVYAGDSCNKCWRRLESTGMPAILFVFFAEVAAEAFFFA